MLPVYIQYMGAETYGLVGFFTMLQAWFGLLDLGLTPTIGRETSRYHGGAISALAYRQIFRSLSILFFTFAAVGGAGLWGASYQITIRWLNVGSLPIDDVSFAVEVMAVSVALRWMCGLYRGVIAGTEKLAWLGGLTILMVTLRFIVVLPVMWRFGFTAPVFFIYQLFVASIELIFLGLKAYNILPPIKTLEGPVGWSLQSARSSLKFAMTIAFASIVWTLTTQSDKLLLSGILSLEEYGYFTLAVVVAGSIIVITSPVSSVIMPRMTVLNAENKQAELMHVYFQSTQLVSVVAGTSAATLGGFAEPLLFAWTGDLKVTQEAAPILRLYAIGYALLAVGAFPYYLQYAKGNLRYHLIGNILVVLLILPGVVFGAHYYGATGAGCAWLTINALYLIAWVGYVHKKMIPGLHWVWFRDGVLKCSFPGILISLVLLAFDLEFESRMQNLGYFVFTLILVFTVNLTSILLRRFR